jgi:D-lactate dehydrogenase
MDNTTIPSSSGQYPRYDETLIYDERKDKFMHVFFELEDWEEALVQQMFPAEQLRMFHEPLGPQHLPLLADCETLVVFIYSRVTREVLDHMPNCKLVCTMSTGYDHVDVAACKEKNITVCNVPSYGDRTVAQHTFTLLLGLTRKLVPSIEQVRRGNFSPNRELRGTDIHSKTIGVIGTGKIGSNVIRIANGFSMSVVAYDPFPNEGLAKELGFRYVSLDELYAQSDIISVHVPLLPSTTHLINEASINKMKQGVILLNTSRGGIIETQPLYNALLSGKVGGAGLDVLEEETAIKEEKQLLSRTYQPNINYQMLAMNHLLVQHPNVLVTPHNAFNSTEALTRIIHTTIDNMQSFQKGAAQNTVKG